MASVYYLRREQDPLAMAMGTLRLLDGIAKQTCHDSAAAETTQEVVEHAQRGTMIRPLYDYFPNDTNLRKIIVHGQIGYQLRYWRKENNT